MAYNLVALATNWIEHQHLNPDGIPGRQEIASVHFGMHPSALSTSTFDMVLRYPVLSLTQVRAMHISKGRLWFCFCFFFIKETATWSKTEHWLWKQNSSSTWFRAITIRIIGGWLQYCLFPLRKHDFRWTQMTDSFIQIIFIENVSFARPWAKSWGYKHGYCNFCPQRAPVWRGDGI